MSLTERYADRLENAEDGSVSFSLRRALKAQDGEVAFLALRRPRFEDMLAQSKQPGDDMDRVGWLIAKLSGVAPSAFEGIDAEDGLVLAEVIGGFLDRLPDEEEERQDGDLPARHADRIVQDDDGAALTLRRPLATKDGEVTQITLRRPTWKEVKARGKANLTSSAKLIATLSGIGLLTLGRIDALDGLILAELVSGFLGNSRPSGGR